MNITVSVMAHPKRKAAAESLALQLKAYPFMDVSITWDQRGSEWDTGARAMHKGFNRGEWHLVLQDDAVLTPHFYENIESAIRNAPERVLISLYTGTVKPLPDRVKEAVDKCYFATWIRFNMLLWGVAILIPSDHIEPMLDFVDTPEFKDTLYDTKIGMFYQRNMLPIYYTMPSLVDHNDAADSLLEHKDHLGARVAHRLATGLVPWNYQVIDL